MKRFFFLALTLAFTVSVFAQDKLLSSKQLMTRSLYPRASIRNIQFVGNTNQIAYIQDDVLYMGQPGKVKPTTILSTLNNTVAAVGKDGWSRPPQVTFVNAKEIRFMEEGEIMQYNIAKKTLVSLGRIATDEEAEHLDVEKNGYKTAYTVGTNLYIKNGDKVFAIEDPDQDIVYGQSVHRNEFGIEKGTFWSPKGNYLAFYRMDQSMVTD